MLKREVYYIGIGGIVKRGFLVAYNPGFIKSIKKTFAFIDLSLIFLIRKILKIFTTIKSSKRNAIISIFAVSPQSQPK